MLESRTILVLALLLLLQTSPAASTNRESDSTTVVPKARRQLSQELFLTYEPLTTVTDDAAIDLDQKLMERLLEDNDEQLHRAFTVYVMGSFSKSYSELRLQNGTTLPTAVTEGTDVFGVTAAGVSVRGSVMRTARQGENLLEVQYHASPVQEFWTKCHVGGNPEPNTEGCFAPNGTLEVGDLGDFSYSYNVTTQTFNGRTLQGFSTKAKKKMYDCDVGCPYSTYNKFFAYYGAHDYANQWVLAAFDRGSTNFDNGNAQFNGYGFEGANEAIKKGTAYMNTWMYVVRQLEHAANMCGVAIACQEADCNNEDPIHAWDKAVAFYTGSQAKQRGSTGYSLYTLAQKRCDNFGTCLTEGVEDGVAGLNSELFTHFESGKESLITGNCVTARFFMKRISELMAVPLVQGTLRYAYTSDGSEKSEAEGATFAAAVLPLLHHCSREDADVVYQNMRSGRNGESSDFNAVKDAFERHYDCMGITCSDVGGLLDVTGSGGYMDAAEPCVDRKQGNTADNDFNSHGDSSESNVGVAVGWTLGIAALFAISAAVLSHRRGDKEFDGPANEEEEDVDDVDDDDEVVVSFSPTKERTRNLWEDQPTEGFFET